MRTHILLLVLPTALSWVLPPPQVLCARVSPLSASGNEIDAPEYKEPEGLEGLSLEEEIDLGVEQEMKKTKVSCINSLRSQIGED